MRVTLDPETLARVEGGPADFKGVNLRAPTIEQKGEGKAGKKASGILMVGGGLYLWVRLLRRFLRLWAELLTAVVGLWARSTTKA